MSSGNMPSPDIVVIGGGLVGAAVAYGLQRTGRRVTILDEGDVAHRASRGNFALVWVQSKGLGAPDYARWTRVSSRLWPRFAAQLSEDTGVDVNLQQTGGFTLCLSDDKLEARRSAMRRLHNQPHMAEARYDILDGDETRRRLPAVGPEVVGSVFSPEDGHVNSLRLFRALHQAFIQRGGSYRPAHGVDTIIPHASGFTVKGPWGQIETGQIVLAAGLGIARLAPMVGLNVPVVPNRGQVLVTEKLRPFLNHPMVCIRQTDEGGVMIGDSQEEAGFDTGQTLPVMATMAEQACRMFPLLREANVVRSWSALRVMSPDGLPVYDRSARWPGASVVTCHSGVTLAAAHALELTDFIAGTGPLPAHIASFSSRRFDVSPAA